MRQSEIVKGGVYVTASRDYRRRITVLDPEPRWKRVWTPGDPEARSKAKQVHHYELVKNVGYTGLLKVKEERPISMRGGPFKFYPAITTVCHIRTLAIPWEAYAEGVLLAEEQRQAQANTVNVLEARARKALRKLGLSPKKAREFSRARRWGKADGVVEFTGEGTEAVLKALDV